MPRSGRIEKVRKTKNLTPHQKNHRWESFSAKIAKFNSLQPLRKVRRHDLETEDLSSTTSYLQTGLAKWAELNISRPFSSFRAKLSPLCESLPQILHFEQRIMDLLAEYITPQDRESLEPLLDLLTAFAHDLGVRFERHYARSLELILAVAGRPQPVEVIEWTFGALAFLYKYLSKLLAPDLRPTYAVVAPLLGKARHPPFIARFAAESMSFLVRKAAAPSLRETALVAFVEHVRGDILSVREEQERQFTLYKDGLMTMFAEAIKGTDRTIHSAGAAIMTALIDSVPEEENTLAEDTTWTDLVCGVLTSVIHHATTDTLADLAEAVLERCEEKTREAKPKPKPWAVVPHVRILSTLGGVRRGTRLAKHWSRLTRQLVEMLGTCSRSAETKEAEEAEEAEEEAAREKDGLVWTQVLANVAMTCHHAPMDAMIPQIGRLVQLLTREPFMRWFIPFCCYFSELHAGRFGSLFRTDFQKFIATHWSQGDNEDMLCVLLPKIIENRAFPLPSIGDKPKKDRDNKDKDCCRLPQGWQDQIVSRFESLEVSPFPEQGPEQGHRDHGLPKYAALLRVLELTAVHPSTNARIAELLLRKVKLALRPSSTLASAEVNFIVSRGFHAYLRMSRDAGPPDVTLRPLLRAAVPRFAQSVGFLQTYLTYERALGGKDKDKDSGKAGEQNDMSSSEAEDDDDPAVQSLVGNLSSPSHDIRLVSLELLAQLLKAASTTGSSGSSHCIDIMLQIEQTPLTPTQTRAIAMLSRKLSQEYASSSAAWLKQGIPNFLFGMMTVNMSPVWDSSVEALQLVSQNKAGEEAISAMAFRWLDVESPRWTPPQSDADVTGRRFYSDFECTAVNALREAAAGTRETSEDAEGIMLRDFDDHQRLAESFALKARAQALKIFNAMPSMAERRSRQLVPLFFSWACEEEGAGFENAQGQGQAGNFWSLSDRKAMMAVFSQFVNPRVLYQNEQVFHTFLVLLGNGDLELQKVALKALLAWKQDGVKPYQENLEYLLDESRFKNEIAVFLQGNDDVIKPEHRLELLPVLLRLLYGRAVSRKGGVGGRHGQHTTRLAILRNLSTEDLGGFLDIAVGKLKGFRAIGSTAAAAQRKEAFDQEIIPPRKQFGFLNMMASLIAELGTHVTPYMDTLVNTILYCLVHACRRLENATFDGDGDDVQQQERDGRDGEEEEEEKKAGTQSLLKSTRSVGIKCLIALFQNAQDFQWGPYSDIIIEEVVAPRHDNLPAETAQGVSGLLQLLSTWSNLPKAALLLGPHETALPNGILPQVIACVAFEKGKEVVKMHALAMLRSLARLALAPAAESEFNEVIKEELLVPNAAMILENITTALKASGSDVSNALLEACVETILALAPIFQDSASVQTIIRISSFLLQQPARRVNPRMKGRILLIIENFVGLPDAGEDAALLDEVYTTASSLFSYFKDRENRGSLCRVVLGISKQDPAVAEVAQLCEDLNSFKEGRIDEPDYDTRLKAFSAISSARDGVLWSPKQWLPLLHNLIYFMRMDEEFGVLATNAADGVRRLIQDCADCQADELKPAFDGFLKNTLLPSLFSGAREPSDTVRRECLRVFGFLISTMPEWPPVTDLSGILSERQEDSTEPSFFFDILSPATSRRLEALQTLERANAEKEMGSQNLSQFFIPLLEHFVFGGGKQPDGGGGDDHQGLGAQAASTISNLAMSLHWNHFRITLHRYIGYIESRPEQQKQTIRLLGKFTDALMLVLQGEDSEAMEVEQTEASSSVMRRLRLTTPRGSELAPYVLDYFLPPLTKHLHEKDESEVSYRVPVGITVVKLLKLLPGPQMEQRLAGVLTDICHILRSKAWEAREMARETLVKIAVLLGPSHFGFILKELRGALTKGYQLHVLSYTMHSILVTAVPQFKPGDLDDCLPSIVTVIMDDIFGTVGQEKDADGYTSQMKEVKSSKSQDSMELISKTATIGRLIDLIRPIRALLMQKVDLRIVRKIDALMARITAGLLQNPAAESRDTLVFCYEVIQEVYNSKEAEAEPKMDWKTRRYLIQRGAKKSGDGGKGKTSKHTYKLIRFSLEILRSMFKKHDSLRTPEHVAGFLPIIGDALLDGQDEVKISAFRLLAVIVKVPAITEDGTSIHKVAVKEATKAIGSISSSTTTDLAQAALKMLAVILREKRDVPVKDAAVDMLLGKLRHDFTEPLYRHVTFNFLRSVLDRRVETAAVYDTLDHVGTVMISNDDKDTRDLARGAFFQFVREYPQKKARWAKQLDFIVANLKYDREGGRISVMEIIHLLLMKSSDEFVQEVAATCFLPLFLVLANDDSEKCRVLAGGLIKEIFRKADKTRAQTFLGLLRSWLDKGGNGNSTVLRLALRSFGSYFECHDGAVKNKSDFKLVFAKVMDTLDCSGPDRDIRSVEGPLVEAALEVVGVFTSVFPEQAFGAGCEDLWVRISQCLRHAEGGVKVAAVRLVSLYLADFARQGVPAEEVVRGSYGLVLDGGRVEGLVRLALRALNDTGISEELAKELGQVLIFLGPRLPVDTTTTEDQSPDDEEEADEDEDEDAEEAGEGVEKPKTLQYLFHRLSHILRREARPTLTTITPKLTAMEVLETIHRRSAPSRIHPSLKTILTPLHNLTDPSIPAPFSLDEAFKAKHEALKTRAQILMDAVQKRFGTAEYSRVLMGIREEVRGRREERARKRKIEAVVRPEKWVGDKRRKGERERERRRERGREQRSMRQAYKAW